jgi:hypothetical protein
VRQARLLERLAPVHPQLQQAYAGWQQDQQALAQQHQQPQVLPLQQLPHQGSSQQQQHHQQQQQHRQEEQQQQQQPELPGCHWDSSTKLPATAVDTPDSSQQRPKHHHRHHHASANSDGSEDLSNAAGLKREQLREAKKNALIVVKSRLAGPYSKGLIDKSAFKAAAEQVTHELYERVTDGQVQLQDLAAAVAVAGKGGGQQEHSTAQHGVSALGAAAVAHLVDFLLVDAGVDVS